LGAIVGVLYVEVADRFIVKPPHPDYERTFTMLLVVLLALALGLERNTRFKRIDSHFAQITRTVELAGDSDEGNRRSDLIVISVPGST
jgi:hypothetical protein